MGLCRLPLCCSEENSHISDVENFLCLCPLLSSVRESFLVNMKIYLEEHFPYLSTPIAECLGQNSPQFFLDASVMPNIIKIQQEHGDQPLSVIMWITRNYCYCLHKARLCLLESGRRIL